MQAELRVEGNGEVRTYGLQPGQRVVLGRGEDVEVPVLDNGASRRHTAIELTPQGLTVTDLGSKNGTLLDGRALQANVAAPVAGSGVVTIGAHQIHVRVAGAPGLVRDDYERLAELGRGAAGMVFAARHRASGREVAIKVLLDRVEDPSVRERFLREGRVRIASPYVVQVYDVRIEGGQVYLIMEYVRGQSLQQRLHQGGPLPIPAAVSVGEQLALGLAAAHAAGVVHRDMKPPNVMLTPEGVAKIADFGIAKLADSGQSLTRSGTGMGTLTYVPPEQAENAKRISPAADLYSLGATLYHCVAGRPPFQPGPELIQQIFEDEPPRLTRLRKDCPRPLAALIGRLLEKDPRDRPPSAEQVASKLATLRAELPG